MDGHDRAVVLRLARVGEQRERAGGRGRNRRQTGPVDNKSHLYCLINACVFSITRYSGLDIVAVRVP
jgi:hypothetical protein